MTVYVLNINDYHEMGQTLTEVFSSLDKAIARMDSLYKEALADPFIYNEFMGENQGIYYCSWTCDWTHIYKGQFYTSGMIVEREVQ